MVEFIKRKHISNFRKRERAFDTFSEILHGMIHNNLLQTSSYNSSQAVYARDFAGVF